MKKNEIQIVWFKRDLRISDHKPIYQASTSKIPLLPIYIVEPEYWEQPFASRRHWHFIHDCLIELRQNLKQLGQGLIVRVGSVVDVFKGFSDHHLLKTFMHMKKLVINGLITEILKFKNGVKKIILY